MALMKDSEVIALGTMEGEILFFKVGCCILVPAAGGGFACCQLHLRNLTQRNTHTTAPFISLVRRI